MLQPLSCDVTLAALPLVSIRGGVRGSDWMDAALQYKQQNIRVNHILINDHDASSNLETLSVGRSICDLFIIYYHQWTSA